MSAASPSAEYVRSAITGLPSELARALVVPLPEVPRGTQAVLTTGIGASEAPARLLAVLLAEAGLCARFATASELRKAHVGEGTLLLVFSQGLSPNAQLALASASRFRACWLVTSVDPERAPEAKASRLSSLKARGVVPIVVPPASEPHTLARFVGPTVAALMALRLCAWLRPNAQFAAHLHDAPRAYRARPISAALDEAELALLVVGGGVEWAQAHRWKLLETLLLGDPPVWEVLQFAHGPLQAFYERPLTLLSFECGDSGPLMTRLQQTLVTARHDVVRLCSERPFPLAFFEHAATLDALLLSAIERRGCDLFNWPARSADAPLYGLSEDPEGAVP